VQKIRVAQDRLQRGAQLVAHHRQEEGLGARRRLRCFKRRPQLHLKLLAHGDIAGD
jgi:hypothetical protein